ncbi:flagellar export chaperone FliS [Sinomonas susongensis]|uniref:flagellar export chaperone FliS n=1 Tax=Sinomonas susongensis TaxID=1324851 RepID=UPI001107D4D3|nr:flagellar export chaperone FliS [Sinomonas susongensis]
MTLQPARARQLYNRDAILSASPVRLLTMIYDRLMLDLHRAEKAQEAADWQAASDSLLHAQDIIAELSATLKSGIWDGAESLRSLYDYVRRALVNANINRNPSLTREAIALVEPLRQSWHQAAASLPAERPEATAALGGYVG